MGSQMRLIIFYYYVHVDVSDNFISISIICICSSQDHIDWKHYDLSRKIIKTFYMYRRFIC